VVGNATSRRILGETLARWGMQVRMEESGPAALDAMREAAGSENPVRLLIVDAGMPGMDGFAVAAEVRRDPRLAGVAIIMLTSTRQPGDGSRCRELGVGACLIKPASQSELRQAVQEAVEGRNCECADSPAPIAELPVAVSRRILLAEDNRVNQTLAVRLLEKQGHKVTVASNGREALAAIARERFDAVLMDVQMPEMDGFEATEAIREREKASGAHLPVIAMTAHAMKSGAVPRAWMAISPSPCAPGSCTRR
jgi:CheY-like chemotaxis protein